MLSRSFSGPAVPVHSTQNPHNQVPSIAAVLLCVQSAKANKLPLEGTLDENVATSRARGPVCCIDPQDTMQYTDLRQLANLPRQLVLGSCQ